MFCLLFCIQSVATVYCSVHDTLWVCKLRWKMNFIFSYLSFSLACVFYCRFFSHFYDHMKPLTGIFVAVALKALPFSIVSFNTMTNTTSQFLSLIKIDWWKYAYLSTAHTDITSINRCFQVMFQSIENSMIQRNLYWKHFGLAVGNTKWIVTTGWRNRFKVGKVHEFVRRSSVGNKRRRHQISDEDSSKSHRLDFREFTKNWLLVSNKMQLLLALIWSIFEIKPK